MTKIATALHRVAATTSAATPQSPCPPIGVKIPLTRAEPARRAHGLDRFASRRGSGGSKAADSRLAEKAADSRLAEALLWA